MSFFAKAFRVSSTLLGTATRTRVLPRPRAVPHARGPGRNNGHDLNEPIVVVMSVVVEPEEQGKGHSRALMDEFVGRMRRMDKRTIYPMHKEHHVPLCQKLGSGYLGWSASDHGRMVRYEVSLAI